MGRCQRLFLGLLALLLVVVWLFPSPSTLHTLPEPLRPHRPWWVILLNTLLSPLVFFGVPSLRARDIMAASELWTGYEDWEDADTTLQDGLLILGEALEKEAMLTGLGRIFARAQLQMSLNARLRIIQFRRFHVGVGDQKITAPVFILGLPRSGTTFLHQLLSQDTRLFRAPLNWEIQDPVPPSDGRETSRNHPRILPIDMSVKAFMALAPNVAAVHNVDAMAAEECMPVLAMAGRTLQFNTLWNVPTYQRWLMAHSQEPALKFHRKFLQHLQSGDIVGNERQRTWLLKTPWHMNHVDDLVSVYPDARIIIPQREPAGMLASISSLNARFYGVFTDAVDLAAIGRFQLWQWETIMERFVKDRSSVDTELFDVRFSDLVNTPLRTVARIYDFLGEELTTEAITRMEKFLENGGRRGRHGKHVYDLNWFSLNESDIVNSNAVNAYCQHFGLEHGFKPGHEY